MECRKKSVSHNTITTRLLSPEATVCGNFRCQTDVWNMLHDKGILEGCLAAVGRTFALPLLTKLHRCFTTTSTKQLSGNLLTLTRNTQLSSNLCFRKLTFLERRRWASRRQFRRSGTSVHTSASDSPSNPPPPNKNLRRSGSLRIEPPHAVVGAWDR